MTTWKALTGRISLFSAGTPPGPSLSALELYRRAWGSNPDNFHSSGNPLSPALAQGKIDGLSVACVLQPVRVDFNVGPVPPPQDATDLSFSVIEDTRRLHSELSRLVDFVGGDTGLSNPVNRVGLYVQFVAEERAVEDANKTLLNVIPAKYRPRLENEEDFILQLNAPNVSPGVEGVRMNYITKWSVDRFQVFNLAVAVSVMPPNFDPQRISPNQIRIVTAASVVYDMNNVPVNDPLERHQQSLLLREGLVTLEKLQREMGLEVGGF